MAATNETVERILRGTLRALARRGSRKLSVSDICDEAGVARATYYRYFSGRDDALAALALHFERGMAEVVAEAVAERPEPERRLEVVLDAIGTHRERNPGIVELVNSEPGFALRFLHEVFPSLVGTFVKAATPALEAVPAVRAGQLTTRQAGELLFRIVMSQVLLPSDEAPELARLVTALWEATPGMRAAAG